MIHKLSPMRWLNVIAFAAALYVSGIYLTQMDGVWNVPQQTHSLILTSFATAAIIAARAERDRRAEERARAETAVRDAAFHAKLDEVRRHVCWMDATAQPALAAQVVPSIRPAAPVEILPPDNVVAFELGRQAERSSNGRSPK